MKNNFNSLPVLEGGKPVRKDFLVFGKPDIYKEDIDEVVDSLKSGWLSTGPKAYLFEEKVKSYIGCKYAIGLNSCTAGLHLALLACDIGPGDEVITVPMTFGATVNVIEHVGATPIFVDVDRSTMNMDPNEIEKKITKKTKAIIPVHMAGRPCDMDEIVKIAKKHNLKIIEDAAHAFGTEYNGKKIGTIGDITVFSFYVTKNITTGEGGIVTTNNKKISEFIRLYSLHGMSKGAWKRYSSQGFKTYLIEVPGYKYNLMDLQAAIGIHQLDRFTVSQKKRKEIWYKYNKAFSDLPVITPLELNTHSIHAYHLYTLLVKDGLKVDRNVVLNAIQAENIGVGIHFTSLHLHPFYRKKYEYKRGDFPNSEYISDRTISIPLSSGLKGKDVDDVIHAVRKVVLYYQKYTSKKNIKKYKSLKKILSSISER